MTAAFSDSAGVATALWATDGGSRCPAGGPTGANSGTWLYAHETPADSIDAVRQGFSLIISGAPAGFEPAHPAPEGDSEAHVDYLFDPMSQRFQSFTT